MLLPACYSGSLRMRGDSLTMRPASHVAHRTALLSALVHEFPEAYMMV